MKEIKARVPRKYVSIEVRSSIYDKDEELFIERMMTNVEFCGMLEYLLTHSAPKKNKK